MKLVPDLIHDQKFATVTPKTTVRAAAQTMTEHNVDAILVVENARLAGIFSEGDLVKRVIAHSLDPDAVTVAEVMTKNPDTLAPGTDVREAMRLMVQNGYRHIPVLDGQRIVGMVSERDIFANSVKSIQSGVSALAKNLLQG